MAKQKKKRNKSYTGSGARVAKPQVTKVTAVKRNKLQLWWLERKRIIRPVAIAVIVIVAVIWLLSELIRAISGSIS